MTVRQIVSFSAAYIGIVAVAIWFDLAVLCAGAPKFNRGCGGFSLYIPLWEIFLAPLPVAAIFLEWWRKRSPPPTARLVAYLVAIFIIAQVGFLVIRKFPILLALEAVMILIAFIVRMKTSEPHSGSHAPLG